MLSKKNYDHKLCPQCLITDPKSRGNFIDRNFVPFKSNDG